MGHGVSVIEVPTVGKPPITSKAGMPVYVGAAPVNRADESNVNRINICRSFDEAEAALGYDDNFEEYPLCEAMRVHLQMYKASPIVLINVLDPGEAAHTTTPAEQNYDLDVLGSPSSVTWEQRGVLPSTVVVRDTAVPTIYTLDTDYTLEIERSTGHLIVHIIPSAAGGNIPADLDTLGVLGDYLDPSGVDETHIIGAMTAGVATGLHCAHYVYAQTGIVPGALNAPYWGREREVKDAIVSIGRNLAGEFRCSGVADLDHDVAEIPNYTNVPGWKASNFYYDRGVVNTWGPMVRYGSERHLLSTHYCALCQVRDAEPLADGIPYVSPSNQIMLADALVTSTGEDVLFTKAQVNTINDQGVVGAVPTRFGYRLWGNRCAIYPADTDPREVFIPLRRMFDWIHNSLMLTHEEKVSAPGNKKQIQSVVRREQLRINGLISAEALIDGRIEFLESENPIADLMAGKVRYHVWLTPPIPMEDLGFIVEFDPAGIAAVFA